MDGQKTREELLEKMKKEFDGVHSAIIKELEAPQVNPKRVRTLVYAQNDIYQKVLQETRALSGDSPYLK